MNTALHFMKASPGGTIENSPAFQRWDQARSRMSPAGTKEVGVSYDAFCRPTGTRHPIAPNPALKQLKRWALGRNPVGIRGCDQFGHGTPFLFLSKNVKPALYFGAAREKTWDVNGIAMMTLTKEMLEKLK